jgi:repressor LexA
MKFTRKQGQYVAFIYNYTRIHGRLPAEFDMEMYFRVSAPSVHQMVLTLEKNGLISRTPGQARSVCVRVPKEEIPQLD